MDSIYEAAGFMMSAAIDFIKILADLFLLIPFPIYSMTDQSKYSNNSNM